MGSPVLEYRPSATPSCAFKSVPVSDDQVERTHRLEDYLKALEDERKKIEAFKRELPFCMQLLHDAIESSRDKLAACRPSLGRRPKLELNCNFDKDSKVQTSSDKTVLEEFIPLKKPTETTSKAKNEEQHAEKRICRHANADKPYWMTEAQLWNSQSRSNGHNEDKCSSATTNTENQSSLPVQEQAFSSSSKLFLHSKQRSGGAFVPFSRDRQIVQPVPRPAAVNPTDLAFPSRDTEVNTSPVRETLGNFHSSTSVKPREDAEQQVKESVVRANGSVVSGSNASQPSRKARRCWSPELHRRFVNALQQLGGSQVATPKQIRELMKVDGLTNDEVKSHLQKYRLHTRRPSPTSQTSAQHSPQLVVLGGIWMPAAHAAAAAAQQAPALFNSAQQPHLCQTPLSQDLYSQLGSPGQMHLHSTIYCDQHCDQRNNAAHSQSSPQGPLQLTGQSSAGIRSSGDACREESVGEDGNSENSNWKGREPGLRSHYDAGEAEDQRSLEGSVNGSELKCNGEDDSDFEDSGGSETSLKI